MRRYTWRCSRLTQPDAYFTVCLVCVLFVCRGAFLFVWWLIHSSMRLLVCLFCVSGHTKVVISSSRVKLNCVYFVCESARLDCWRSIVVSR